MAPPIFPLILAGGSGERFWPLSRRARPKQFLPLAGDSSLLAQTVARLEGLAPKENILILTNRDQLAGAREILPDFPAANILAEPAKRDTAAAIALGVAWISLRNRAATMVVLPADHLIHDTAGFRQTLATAATAAHETGDLVTIGVKPTWPCPGFGYIEMGAPATIPGLDHGGAVHEVVRFREKPNAELAETFVRQGNFRWNAGMFIWTLPAILSAFDRHAAPLATFVHQVHECSDLPLLLEERFPQLPKISIDYAVMEKADRVLMVEAGFDWDDVGSWIAVAKYLAPHPAANRANAPLTALAASNNIVFTNPGLHVALMGVRDLIVVHTGDALLVCRREDAEQLKRLVATLPPNLQ